MRRLFILIGALVLFTAPALAESTIYLIRHADDVPGAGDVELLPEGHARALWLKDYFADKGITHIFTSDYIRTRDTVTPLGGLLGIDYQIYDPRDLPGTAEMLKGLEDVVAVVAGHSNTTPVLADLLFGEARYEWLEDWQFDHIYRVQIADDGAVSIEIMFSEPRSVAPVSE